MERGEGGLGGVVWLWTLGTVGFQAVLCLRSAGRVVERY